jgi:hypothetical protein
MITIISWLYMLDLSKYKIVVMTLALGSQQNMMKENGLGKWLKIQPHSYKCGRMQGN